MLCTQITAETSLDNLGILLIHLVLFIQFKFSLVGGPHWTLSTIYDLYHMIVTKQPGDRAVYLLSGANS